VRIGSLAAVALVLCSTGALAQEEAEEAEAPDAWLGCWTRVYDAVHLAKHSGQKISSLTLSITPREGATGEAPGNYRAKITAMFRDKPDSYSNLDGARCVASEQKLSCFADGFFLGRFSLEPAGKNMKLALRGADEHLALVPGVELSAFTVLSPQNPEHALFLLNPAPAKACGR
jgi:hypothetical protein